jgi:AraC family transcriptional regulator
MPIPQIDILQLLKAANDKDRAESNHLLALSQRSGWSKFHLHREFHRVTGETPKQYTQRVRLERAAAQLNASRKSVIDIALAAGFQSHEVFTRAFKKRFNCSPSAYRKKSLMGKSQDDQSSYRSLVHTISPCTGLFYLGNKAENWSQNMKDPEIKRVTLDPQPILYIRRKVEQAQLQPYFAECFGKLFGYGMQHGLPITGQPIARYIAIGPGQWTVDCVLPLAEPVKGEGEMQAGELDGGVVIKAMHFGPYEALNQSYVAIETWMEEEGVSPTGANWEQYVTDPGEEPDSSKWQTDIYWPIA